VTVSLVEILAGKVFDLLAEDGDWAPPLRVLEDGRGRTLLAGANEVEVASAEGLMTVLEAAMAARATASTGVHEHSSRSHAVCRITLRDADRSATDGFRGMLMLVDLAGSERNADSWTHNAERRKECIEINVSLSALKECIRKRAMRLRAKAEGRTRDAKRVHMPFRRSVLTRILRDALVDERGGTAVIATVSPSASDTEHSHNTLQHACLMAGLGAAGGSDPGRGGSARTGAVAAATAGAGADEVTLGAGGEVSVRVCVKDAAVERAQHRMREKSLVRTWSAEAAKLWWLRTAATVERRIGLPTGTVANGCTGLDGRVLMRMGRTVWVQRCSGSEAAADAMQKKMLDANDEATRVRTEKAKKVRERRRRLRQFSTG
jgi:hypothetical protein